MHPDVSEKVLVDVNCSVTTSSWDDFLLLLIENNVLLELLWDADDLLVSEVRFVAVAATNLGQVTLLLHLLVLLRVLICDGTVHVLSIRNEVWTLRIANLSISIENLLNFENDDSFDVLWILRFDKDGKLLHLLERPFGKFNGFNLGDVWFHWLGAFLHQFWYYWWTFANSYCALIVYDNRIWQPMVQCQNGVVADRMCTQLLQSLSKRLMLFFDLIDKLVWHAKVLVLWKFCFFTYLISVLFCVNFIIQLFTFKKLDC